MPQPDALHRGQNAAAPRRSPRHRRRSRVISGIRAARRERDAFREPREDQHTIVARLCTDSSARSRTGPQGAAWNRARTRITARSRVAQRDGAAAGSPSPARRRSRVHQPLLHDADVAREAARAEAHGRAVDERAPVIAVGRPGPDGASRLVVHRRRALAGVEEVDGATGGAGLGHHRDAVRGDEDAIGQRQQAVVGVARVARCPAVREVRRIDRREQRVGSIGPCTCTGRQQQRAAEAAGQRAGREAEAAPGAGVERIRTAVAAGQHRDQRPRQVREPRLPLRGFLGETLVRHPVQGRLVLEDVQRVGQPVLGGGDDQVPAARARPRASHVHELHGPVGTAADPAGDRLVAAPGRDHEVRPGRAERARALAVDARQRARERPVHQRLPGRVDEALDLEGPAERLAERQHLGVVAGPVCHQQPDAGDRSGRACRSAGADRVRLAQMVCSAIEHRLGPPGGRRGGSGKQPRAHRTPAGRGQRVLLGPLGALSIGLPSASIGLPSASAWSQALDVLDDPFSPPLCGLCRARESTPLEDPLVELQQHDPGIRCRLGGALQRGLDRANRLGIVPQLDLSRVLQATECAGCAGRESTDRCEELECFPMPRPVFEVPSLAD